METVKRKGGLPIKPLSFLAVAAIAIYPYRGYIATLPAIAQRDMSIIQQTPKDDAPRVVIRENKTVYYVADFDGVTVERTLPKTVYETLQGDMRGLACLARNAYHEARGQSAAEQAAVNHTVLNRRFSGEFAGDICAVVYAKAKSGCQFAWTCDGLPDTIKDADTFQAVFDTAIATINGDYDTVNAGQMYFCNRDKFACHFHESKLNRLGKICLENIKGAPFCRQLSEHTFYEE